MFPDLTVDTVLPMNVVYDIPVLHIENRLVAKGRWGKPEIEEVLRAWDLKESTGESNR